MAGAVTADIRLTARHLRYAACATATTRHLPSPPPTRHRPLPGATFAYRIKRNDVNTMNMMTLLQHRAALVHLVLPLNARERRKGGGVTAAGGRRAGRGDARGRSSCRLLNNVYSSWISALLHCLAPDT